MDGRLIFLHRTLILKRGREANRGRATRNARGPQGPDGIYDPEAMCNSTKKSRVGFKQRRPY